MSRGREGEGEEGGRAGAGSCGGRAEEQRRVLPPPHCQCPSSLLLADRPAAQFREACGDGKQAFGFEPALWHGELSSPHQHLGHHPSFPSALKAPSLSIATLSGLRVMRIMKAAKSATFGYPRVSYEPQSPGHGIQADISAIHSHSRGQCCRKWRSRGGQPNQPAAAPSDSESEQA